MDLGRKAREKSVLVRAICGKDSRVKPKMSFPPDSRSDIKYVRREQGTPDKGSYLHNG